MRIASLATIPGREAQLKKTVESLLPQVDRIYIALNGKVDYRPKDQRVHLIFSDNSKGDAAKFFFMQQLDGIENLIASEPSYLYTCDDDIIYNAGYCDKMEEGCKKYPNSIVTIHGRYVKQGRIKNYHSCYEYRMRCRFDENKDRRIHIPGTGVMCMPANITRPTMADFKHKNMADIWMGIFCQKFAINIMGLAHDKSWIKVQHVSGTIFNQHKELNKVMTPALNSIQWI